MIPRSFDQFAAIDWSGQAVARPKGIAVAVAEVGAAPPRLVERPNGWSREDLIDWLFDRQSSSASMLIGLDLSPALPFADRGAYFPGWPESPADAKALWSAVDAICAGDPYLSSTSLVDHAEASRHFRRHGGRTGAMFGTGRGRLRLVEHRQLEQRLSPTSCFNLVGAAQVGKSSLTGMRVLHRLGGSISVWPFDPMPPRGPVIVEIYTTIAARAAGMPSGRSKVRDPAALDTALAVLGSAPHASLTSYDDHATDAIMTAAWLRRAAADPALWSPPGLAAVAATEGWTFGVR